MQDRVCNLWPRFREPTTDSPLIRQGARNGRAGVLNAFQGTDPPDPIANSRLLRDCPCESELRQVRCDREVRDGRCLAAQKGMALQAGFQDGGKLGHPRLATCDRLAISLRAEEDLVEDDIDHWPSQMALVPIETLLDKRSPRQLLGIPGRQAVLVAEISQDRIGLEDFDRAIDQRRNLVIRVDSQIGRRHCSPLSRATWRTSYSRPASSRRATTRRECWE